MKKLTIILILGIYFLCLSVSVRTQILDEEQWREEVSFVLDSIISHHPNPFHAVSETDFRSRINRLDQNIPLLADHEIVVELSAIVAMIQDGHTKIEGGLQFLSGLYPLRLRVFENGIFVIAAAREYSTLVGLRLMEIDGIIIDEVYHRVATMISYDNEMTHRNRVPESMMIPEILHALAVTNSRDNARFTFLDEGDKERIFEIKTKPFAEPIDWVYAELAGSLPIYLQNMDTNYWHRFLEEGSTLYVQYNSVRNSQNETIEHYFHRLTEIVNQSTIEDIVLDVRFNGGGNGFFNRYVVDWVKESLSVIGGDFYLVIGRATFSAGQKLVTTLDNISGVILVGEATGSSPNHFGDANRLKLPHSDLTLAVSSIYHEDDEGNESKTSDPDLKILVFSADYFSGKDPVLDSILSD